MNSKRSLAVACAIAGFLIHRHLYLTTPIHEFGHIIATYLSGGQGWITSWVSCQITKDSPFVAVAGQWFEAVVLWTVGMILVWKLRRYTAATLIGSWLLGASPNMAAFIYKLYDYSDLRRMWPGDVTTTMTLYWVFYVGSAFYITLLVMLTPEEIKSIIKDTLKTSLRRIN